ncbi:hypothetical protein Tco_0701351 [Tanacetum coccineum]
MGSYDLMILILTAINQGANEPSGLAQMVIKGNLGKVVITCGRFAPQLHESADGLPKTKLVSHSCSLAGSTSAMEPGREHECNESFKLGRPPALS